MFPNWEKQGILFRPKRNGTWLKSHAALPVADQVGKRHRIYFSGRDEKNRSRIGYFEVDFATPHRILRVSRSPVIGVGPLGAFDDSGVTSACMVTHRNRKYLYYTGWSRGTTVPFYFYVGLAVSRDGGHSFRRVSASPILERDAVDPYLTASPSVLVEEGRWRMWYVSGTGWVFKNGRPKHYYHIKYAESGDGIRWIRKGIVCIDYASPQEHAIARPTVLRIGDTYRMWFSCRGTAYKLGYAESRDGIHWRRDDNKVQLQGPKAGWDSEMRAYPFVFRHEGRLFMLYNGNGYGRTGIGYAVGK